MIYLGKDPVEEIRKHREEIFRQHTTTRELFKYLATVPSAKESLARLKREKVERYVTTQPMKSVKTA